MAPETTYLVIALAPLLAAVLSGFLGRQLGRTVSHSLCIAGVAISCALSCWVLMGLVDGSRDAFNGTVYTWGVSDGLRLEVGFLVDHLTALMMVVVTFVSLMVHVYTIGYMHDDPGYQRFFAYISLFTFSMLMLVMANNFLQLFFGWEAVGLVSYLLIGFWYRKPTAIHANLKAFVVNRIGDFGFILGIAAIYYYTGSLNYAEVFSRVDAIIGNDIYLTPGEPTKAITLICILLFIGAMGKSAQVPLHVWLPDSMEGPTPISALIHAATMVTAGIFMVARLSPLFELSSSALSYVMAIGATTALFMGVLGLVNNDIKRVVAYSTLSQLGYMTVALGAGAYSAGIFHLMTHAFFKALLFLAAGSVIIAMHHEQDMRRMGGLWRYLPVTYATSLIGTLALIGFPGFAGFFSKDLIIEAVHASTIDGAGYAYFCVLAGVFITSLYSFRLLFMTFHGKPRMDEHTREHLHESPWVVTLPLIALAIPSVLVGWVGIGPVVFGGFFEGSIQMAADGPIAKLAEGFHGPAAFLLHALQAPAVYLALAGAVAAWYLYLRRPDLPERFRARLPEFHRVLDNKYYFDWFNEHVLATGARAIGLGLWRGGDERIIDGVMVNGSASVVGRLATVVRSLQTGYLYHYAFTMIIGLAIVLGWLLLRGGQ
ncbi:MAG: NADH-quinone oxidoreductase subunit L [Steroidobacteraceae bacterium]